MATVLKRKAASLPEREPIYTAEQVAEILSVTTPTVKRWMTDGLITYVYLQKGRRIPASALGEFL